MSVKVLVDDGIEDVESGEFKKLLQFLLKYKRRIEHKESELRKLPISSTTHFVKTSSETSNESLDKPQKRLWCCIHTDQNEHPIWKFDTFIKMRPDERMAAVRENHACFICLLQKHSACDCPRDFKCRIENCGKSHHYLLHEGIGNGKSFLAKENGNDVALLVQQISVGNGISEPNQ